MCDTMVALGNSTRDGSVLFAKNSDRQPNEPHVMIRVPRRKYDIAGAQKELKTTYLTIPQVAETYEVLLLKPSWIWGCEMGSNEFGLNIGNEAVFTKEKYGKMGLLGMDLARLALERCRTSEEAVNVITELLGLYGQGGNCGYEKPFTYHNSFLIADPKSAWVLETAGPYWAAKKVRDVYCISNCLSIETDFDQNHPDLVKHAVDKGWCRSEKDFSFRKCYSDPVFTYFSKAERRLETCRANLERERGQITVATMKYALRSHADRIQGRQFSKSSVQSVCMHSGGFIGDHTTGSYIASLEEKHCSYWVTGASTPCISVFKPLWLLDGAPVFAEADQAVAIDYWKTREKLHRLILEGRVDLERYIEDRDNLEQSFERLYNETNPEAVADELLVNTAKVAFHKEAEFIEAELEKAGQFGNRSQMKGSIFFKHYWRNRNRKLENSHLFNIGVNHFK
jgi:secernin